MALVTTRRPPRKPSAKFPRPSPPARTEKPLDTEALERKVREAEARAAKAIEDRDAVEVNMGELLAAVADRDRRLRAISKELEQKAASLAAVEAAVSAASATARTTATALAAAEAKVAAALEAKAAAEARAAAALDAKAELEAKLAAAREVKVQPPPASTQAASAAESPVASGSSDPVEAAMKAATALTEQANALATATEARLRDARLAAKRLGMLDLSVVGIAAERAIADTLQSVGKVEAALRRCTSQLAAVHQAERHLGEVRYRMKEPLSALARTEERLRLCMAEMSAAPMTPPGAGPSGTS